MSEETSLSSEWGRLFRDALKLSLDLFKIMVPIIIGIKFFQELGLIPYLAVPLNPFMKLVGLPPEMGLVWATAMLNNLYGAVAVFLSLATDITVTTAQATVLCTMMLVAHTLPIELKIAQASGPRLMFQAATRLGSALMLGWILHAVYSGFDLLQGPAAILLKPEDRPGASSDSLLSWALGQARNLLSIFIIILVLFFLIRILKRLRITDGMNRLLRPVLGLMGIGPKAATITVIGLTLGVSYGGGLIIHEARSGHLNKQDVFYALTLMGLSHALIEDTLLMVMIGGHLSGLLLGRVIFSLLAVAVLVKATARLPARFSDKYVWGPPR
jgi:hypothetical protein